MADINSVITKIQAAMDEASAVAGTPTQAQQIADLTTQLATANADKASLQTKYDNYTSAVRAAAQADKDNDDAKEAGSGVLNIPV